MGEWRGEDISYPKRWSELCTYCKGYYFDRDEWLYDEQDRIAGLARGCTCDEEEEEEGEVWLQEDREAPEQV